MNAVNFKKSLKRWLLVFRGIFICSEGKNTTLRFKIGEEYELHEFDLIPLGDVKSENSFAYEVYKYRSKEHNVYLFYNCDILSAYCFVNEEGKLMRFKAKKNLKKEELEKIINSILENKF